MGPDYQQPKTQVPVKYKNDAPWKQATPKDTQSRGKWWEIYHDPMLNKLEEQAAESSQTLQAAYARLTQAQAALGISQADRIPRLDLNASASRQRTGDDLSMTGSSRVNSQFNAPLVLSYEVDLWGRVKRSIEAAQANTESAVADYQAMLLSLQAEVARTYFALGSTDAEISLLEQTMELRRATRDMIKSKFNSGQVDQLDLSRAEAELAFTESDAIGLTRQRGELENSLAVLIGQAPSTFSLATVSLPLAPPVMAPGMPSDLLERRPDVAAAERMMAAASAKIGVAKTAFFPAISLTGSTGFASNQFDSLFNWDNRTWGLGPAISLPIFDAHRNSANLDRARAAYEEAVANYRQQVLVAFQEVENGLNGLQVLDRQGRSLRLATAMSKQAWQISEKRYKAGMASYLEVVDTQRSALDAERTLTQLQGDQLTTSVLLIKALGGGW
jgi:multidrug efflux system outer membrane protein